MHSVRSSGSAGVTVASYPLLLEHLLVRDTLWLKVVQHHHEIPPPAPLAQLQPVQRLVRINQEFERPLASCIQARAMLGLSQWPKSV